MRSFFYVPPSPPRSRRPLHLTHDTASTNEKPSLVKVLRSAFGLKFYLAAIPKIIQDSMGFLSPLLLKWLVDWVSGSLFRVFIFIFFSFLPSTFALV